MPNAFRSQRAPLAIILVAAALIFTVSNVAFAATPTLSSISPVNGSLGQTVSVTLTGTGFSAGGAFINLGGLGVGVTNVSVVNDTSMTATFQIVPNASTGGRSISVTTTGGTSTTVNFGVLGAPTLSSITSPGLGTLSILTVGAAYSVSLTGTNFAAGATAVNVSGSGVTVSNVVSTNSTVLRTAVFTVASNAAAGTRSVTVSTAAGTAALPITVNTDVSSGYMLSTVAGQDAFSEGAAATSQALPLINDVAFAPNGNLYLAVPGANKVYQVSNGLISTFAGTGVLGASGDGGPATSAQLNYPLAVIADSQSNIYIAEGNAVRKVSAADGTISTIAGGGGAGYSGDNGSAFFEKLQNPSGLGIDSSDNLYVIDAGNNRIVKITAATGAITTIAGTFQCFGFSGDNGPATQACLNLDLQTSKLAVDPSGNIYFPDSDNYRIRMIAASNGVISTIAGTGGGYSGDNGAASAAGLGFPTAVVLDSSNPSQFKLYIADNGSSRVRGITGTTVISTSSTITTVAGNGGFLFTGDGSPATSFAVSPLGMALDGSGNLYIVDSESNRVRLLSSGALSTVAGNSGVFSGDNGPAASAQFYLPQSIATDPSNNLFIADTGNARVREVSFPGNTVTTIAGTGTTLSLTASGEGGPATSAVLGIPWAVATTTSGTVYIAASTTVFGGTDSRIWQVGLDHNIHTIAGGSTSGYNGDNIPATSAQLNGPLGVVVDPSGNIYIADACNFRVRKVTAATGMITTIAGNGTPGYSGDGGQGTSAQLTQPRQLALDSLGNLYIQDRGNNDSRCDNGGNGNNQGEIRKVATDGTISTFSTAGSNGVAVGGGTVFVGGNASIFQIFPDGGGASIAGGGGLVSNVFNSNGLSGLSGDNGPALVGLIGTDALAVNSLGEVLFVDQNDYVVRKATPQTSPVITALPFGVSARGGAITPFTSALSVGVWGNATAAWNATASVTTPSGGHWLSISPSSGTGTAIGTLAVTYDVTGLSAGTYNGSITFTSTPAAANTSFTVPVTLTIPPQNIQVSPPDIFMVATAGGFLQPQNVSVLNQGLGGGINFNASAIVTSPQWLSVTPSSGSSSPQANGFVTLSYNLAGLSAGVYSGGVTVSSAAGTAAVNSPITVPVFLQLNAPNASPFLSTISPANGALGQAVNVTLTGSNFLLNPTVNVSGSGVTVSNVTAVSASSITATLTIAGTAATGVRTISVTTAVATSNSQNFTILGVPTLTSISPAAGSTGSAVSVTLTGTGFANGGSTVTVDGSGVTAAVTNFTSATSLTALLTIAANATTGAHNLTVTTQAGTTSPVTFTVSSEAGYTVTTVAGTAFVMEGGPATSQPLPFFFDVARDSIGNLYIAAQNANKVFKVSGGVITTFAGTGTPGPYGDGGPAASAQLNQPRAVLVDANNNVLIADSSNNRIRKVTADGTLITTFAGTGAGGFNGDGGPAIFAQLSAPSGLGIDSSGNVYIHDFNNRRIRQVDTNGVMSTMAGNGLTGYNGDGQALLAELNLDSQTSKLAVDGAGNLYIPDAFNNRIRKVTPGGVISTFAGIGTSGSSGDSGPAAAAALNTPRAVAFDASGNLFIADANNNRIRKVNGSGNISTVAGNGFNGFNGDGGAGTATNLQLTNPIGMATDPSGNVYFADSGSNRLRELTTGGALTTLAGNTGGPSNDGGAASSTLLYQPNGVALDLNGNLLIADSRDFRIRKVDAVTGNVRTIAGCLIPSPCTGSGTVSGDGGMAISAGLGFISDIFVDSSGNIFVSGSNRVRIITTDGKINTFAGTGTSGYNGDSISATTAQLNNPQGMTMDGSGNLYIADSNNQRVRMVSAGTITTVAGNGTSGSLGDNGAATSANLNNPRHLAFDANSDPYGPNHLYIADSNNSKIRVVVGGTISTFSTFGGAAVAYNSGNLYIASGSQIQRGFPDGTSSTIAGLAFGDTGDNGPALMASLNVTSLIANSSGTVFAADSSDNVVRMLSQVSAGSAVLSVSPAGFNFRLGNNNSTGNTATITLGGAPTTNFTWTAAASVTTPSGGEWLTLPVTSGTGGFPLGLTANASGLAPGIYNGSVSISSPQAANSPVTVPVTLNVLPSTLSTSASSFTPSATAGGSNPGSTNFTVTQGGSGVSFAFTAAAAVVTPLSGTWLSVAPGSGTTGSGVNFMVSYNITGLSAGVYTGSIILTAANASNSPLVLPVTLTINPNTAPTLTSITPINGLPGQTVNVTLTGTNFNPTSASNIISVGGSGVTVTNTTFVSGTMLFATFTISNSATLGPDNVTVSNGVGTSGAVIFTVGAVKKRGGQITSQ
ncbi:MAG TPA: IPT/TIG domain-containing protein [Terriglobia bacterium]|jgi:hypothetical protein